RSALLGWRLGGVTDEHECAGRAGDRAADEEQVLLRVDRLDHHVLHGEPSGAHTTRHAHALEDASRGRARSDRAGRAVLALDTVASAKAVEAVPLHDTGEALALGLAGDVDQLSFSEGVDGHLLTKRVLAGVGGPKLHDVAAGRDARLRVVAGFGLV